MKYFIDFEATQFSEEIISVGCIREDGETFYSLVAPVEGKLTPFITNLTGITKEMLDKAMTPDVVFAQFYEWIKQDFDNLPELLVWGNSDVDFLRHTFRRTASIEARMAIGYMCGSIRDYSKIFCKRAKADSCSLLKAYHGLINSEWEQNHNALDDAVMLKEVYDAAMSIETNDLRIKMADYITVNKPATESNGKKASLIKWSQMGFEKGTLCMINSKNQCLQHFANLDEAIDWVISNQMSTNQKDQVKRENVLKRIKQAYGQDKKYYGHAWRMVA